MTRSEMTFQDVFDAVVDAKREPTMTTAETCAALFGVLREALAERDEPLYHSDLFEIN